MDEAIKDQSIDELNGLLALLKIPERATSFYRTEFTTLSGGERRCDLVCNTENNYMLNIESSYKIPQYWDISRQISYGMRIHMSEWRENPKNPKWKNTENFIPVESIFITAQKTDKKEMNINLKKNCPNLGSEIYTFKDIKHQKYIKQIKNKISKSKDISYEEIAFLKFIALTTKITEIHKALMEAIKLLNQDKTIDKEIRDKIELIYIRNTILYVDEEHQDPIWEGLKMNVTSLNNFEEYVRVKSMKEGIEKGKEEERNRIEKILKSENIPKETINKIMKKSKENII